MYSTQSATFTNREETKSCKCVALPQASPHLPCSAWQVRVADNFAVKVSVFM